MTLKQKHEQAIDEADFLITMQKEMVKRVEEDKTSSCWDKSCVKGYAESQVEQLSKLSKDERLKLPLYGISVGVKDLFAIRGMKTTAGSAMLMDFKTPYDSHMWSVLKSKGTVLGGKTAMDEFAMGSYSDTSIFERVSLPGHMDRTAGGSSGGSGASLAAGLFDFTVGSDTGGSVRLPASYCSLFGYKPTYGGFSRYGMVPYASSLDQAGLMTHCLEDLMYLLDAWLSEQDDRDMTSFKLESEVFEKQKLSIGWFPEVLEQDGVHECVKIAYEKELKRLSSFGVLKEFRLPLMSKEAQVYYIIACAEASSDLARYQGIYFGKKLVDEGFEGTYWEQVAQLRSKYFGLEVQKRLMLGAYVLSAENKLSMFEKAKAIRKALTHSLESQFDSVDVMVMPTATSVAPKWDEIKQKTSQEIYMSDSLTVPFSLSGLPVVSAPLYQDAGLGIGMQFVGARKKDFQLLSDLKKLGV